MLRIDDRLSSYSIAAGEPWIMSVQMKRMQGSAIIDWSQRRLVQSFYSASRELIEQIEGVYTSDASGAYFAFIRDGRFSEKLFQQSVQVELAERLLEGRVIIATGPLTVAPSSLGVTSFGSAIGRVDARFTLYFDTAGMISLIEQDLLPYGGNPAPAQPSFTTAPIITGTPQVGQTLTANDGVVANGSVTGRQWLLNGTAISGAMGLAYAPVAGDAGSQISLRVNASGAGGTASATSQPVTIQAATPSAPSFTVDPSISGTVAVGQTLTGSDGTITNGTVSARQWQRGGVDISGATGNTYVLTSADAGTTITYKVIATNAGGSTPKSSAGKAVPAAPTFSASPTISHDGTPQVGETLTGNDGTATNGNVTFRRWLLNGTAISGATGSTYAPLAADVGKQLTFQNDASGAGGTSTATSQPITIGAAGAANGDLTSVRVRDSSQLDPDTGSPVLGINGDGWTFELNIKGLTAPLPDNTSDQYFDATKFLMVVRDYGYDGQGNQVWVYRRIVGRCVLRKQYKTAMTDTNGRFISQDGSDMGVIIAGSDQIYDKTELVSATLQAGFYANGSSKSNASMASTLTNASTFTYRKATAGWAMHPKLRAGGDMTVELVAYHRHAMGGRQVACVKFQARDTTGNSSPEVTVSTPTLSTAVTAAGATKVECFKATIAVAALKQAEMCYANAKVYPWIGDASAVYDLSVDGLYKDLTPDTNGTPHTRLRFFNDKDGTYGCFALVDAAAVYAPICSPSAQSGTGANAFDGNYSSGFGWLSQNGGTDQWVGQTFPVAVSIEEVRIWASGYGANNTFNNFDLEWSDDGSTWTKKGATQVAATWTTAYAQSQAFNPGGAARAARYWRVRQNGKTASGSFTGAQEIEFATAAGGINMATGAAAATLAAARLTPVATPDAAWRVIRAFNKANPLTPHDDYAAGRMVLGNSTANTVEYGALADIPVAATALTWCEITVDPSAVGPVKWSGKANVVKTPTMTRVIGVTLKPAATANWTLFNDGASSAGLGMMSVEGCALDSSAANIGLAGGTGIYGFAQHYRSNNTSALGSLLGLAGPGTDPRALCLAVGNVQPMTANVVGAQVMLANKCSAPSEGAMPSWTDGYIWSNNEFRFDTGPALDLKSISRPTVIAQDLWEFRGANGGVIAMNASADGVITPVYEYLDMHNTRIGNRGSRMYLDRATARGVFKHGVSVGNFDTNYNWKTDTFDGGLPGNTGNWRYGHQVGCRSNVSGLGSFGGSTPGTGSYLGMAWDMLYSSYMLSSDFTVVAAQFKDWQGNHNDSANWPGGGDYHLVSANGLLSNRVPAAWAAYDAAFTQPISGAIFKYDLDGRQRWTDGTGAVGCYERPN